MSVQIARSLAERLAEKFGSGVRPIDVKSIADALGLKVVEADLGADVSGLLVTNEAEASICVNTLEPGPRQRFTIAHEIGHFVLRHQFEPGEHVHVDKGNFISQRGMRASAGLDPKEIEANQFAACLLMPSKPLRERITELVNGGHLLDQQVADLAHDFDVSEQAMTIRLAALGII